MIFFISSLRPSLLAAGTVPSLSSDASDTHSDRVLATGVESDVSYDFGDVDFCLRDLIFAFARDHFRAFCAICFRFGGAPPHFLFKRDTISGVRRGLESRLPRG